MPPVDAPITVFQNIRAAVFMFLGAVAFYLFLVLLTGQGGCAPIQRAADSPVVATGTAIDKAGAYTDSAEAAVQAAIPHTDSAGLEDLHLATKSHDSVKINLGAALQDLYKVEDALNAANAAKIAAQNQVAALDASWGHELQVWVTAVFWVIIALLAVHILFGAAAMLFPEYRILGLVSKIVNPLGWFTWLVSHATSGVTITKAI